MPAEAAELCEAVGEPHPDPAARLVGPLSFPAHPQAGAPPADEHIV